MEGAGGRVDGGSCGAGGDCGPVGEGERADSAGVVIHTGVDGGRGCVSGQASFLTFETKNADGTSSGIVHRRALNAEAAGYFFFTMLNFEACFLFRIDPQQAADQSASTKEIDAAGSESLPKGRPQIVRFRRGGEHTVEKKKPKRPATEFGCGADQRVTRS